MAKVEAKDFYVSQERFKNIEGENFSIAHTQFYAQGRMYEYRLRKSDNRLCIIVYYSHGSGYTIFEEEK